jgi:mannosyl-3-phosphoglycerate phosphatase
LLARNYEVVINTSKTRFEVEYYLSTWGLKKPFIVENGSAVYVPENYFPDEVTAETCITRDSYIVIELGKPYDEIKGALDGIAPRYGLKYYGNSTLEEVVAFTGLPRELAELAMRREYSDTTFSWKREGFKRELETKGFRVSRGTRFIGVTGNTDKGMAAGVLLGLYSRLDDVESYALGDGENDFSLFEVVDNAFIVGNLFHPKAKHINSIEEFLEVIP